MSGDETSADEASPDADAPGAQRGTQSDGSQRARLAFALGGAVLLAAIIAIVLVAQGSEDEDGVPTATCFVTWNDDPRAPTQDGIHAYTAHGYRETLVTRLDRDGQIVGLGEDSTPPDDPEARCAVIFASPQPDFEPDFGVRVYDPKGFGGEPGWTGLVLTDGTALKDIADLQAQAVAESNAMLSNNGTLSEE